MQDHPENPQAKISTTGSDKFWDKTAEKYSKSTVSDDASYQRKIRETQEFLSPQMRVVEFGCGTGTTAIEHASRVEHIDAIDVSENMLQIGRTRAEQAGVTNIAFHLGTLDQFSAADSSIDAVLGLNVIHLIQNRQALFREVLRILKPGGVFISSTACLGKSWFRFLAWLLPLTKLLGLTPDVFVMSEDQLAQEIESAGFRIERQWHHGKNGIAVFLIAIKT